MVLDVRRFIAFVFCLIICQTTPATSKVADNDNYFLFARAATGSFKGNNNLGGLNLNLPDADVYTLNVNPDGSFGLFPPLQLQRVSAGEQNLKYCL
ncbi:MAG TPA: hypothetical protein VFE50_18430 [Cyclobacteriaceae bacterium]|nr:hypothetical protein [Cyclobacteriaceae bacterium]